ncbi:unnamed protein product [Lymnaea stagnalis]|uniref:Fucosyltransferase n=1 Tax=Lymnaea stagnalis TaxID=6523 RepID=A0AAV2HV47_LYMST
MVLISQGSSVRRIEHKMHAFECLRFCVTRFKYLIPMAALLAAAYLYYTLLNGRSYFSQSNENTFNLALRDFKDVSDKVNLWGMSPSDFPMYMPVNEATVKGFYGRFPNKDSSKEIKEAIVHTLKSGIGIQPHVDEAGWEGWVENGVVFRPHVKPNVTEKFPSPHASEYDPYIPFNETVFFDGTQKVEGKKIILWYIKTRYAPPMASLEPMRFCPEFPCLMTSNRKFADQSSAMVFAGEIIEGIPPPRRPEQVFIFSNHEPATNRWWEMSQIKSDNLGWKGVFNWTMTYRFDSDVTSLYGIVRRRLKRATPDYAAILSRKRKLAAWIVSNCVTDGRRDLYVKELQKYINVDVYGGCGEMKCPRHDDAACFEMTSTNYKFYLSFENAICTDYVTEKFFRYLNADVVVVARGDNSYHRHVPPELFLNTADFPSPKALAERLMYLDKHDDEYLNILKEKDKYISIFEDYPIRDSEGRIKYMHYHYEAVAFCEVCQRLWNLDKYRRSIPDIREWFKLEMCRKPTDIEF